MGVIPRPGPNTKRDEPGGLDESKPNRNTLRTGLENANSIMQIRTAARDARRT